MQFLLLLFLSSIVLIAAAPVAEVVQNVTEDSLYIVKGDMRFPKSSKLLRTGDPNFYRRWPKGIIPYVIGTQYTATERNNILQAMGDYHRHTCIRWVARTNQADYVDIQKRSEGACWSYVGIIGGAQQMNLESWCVESRYKAVTLHELNHAVGFFHEQDRIDRDDYLNIVWAKINPSDRGSYGKSETSSFGVPYDYNSVMHYETDQNNPTMVAKFGSNVFLGPLTTEFTSWDIEKIRRMYKCEGSISRL